MRDWDQMLELLKKRAVSRSLIALCVLVAFFIGNYLGYANRPAKFFITGIDNKEDVVATGKVDFAPFWKTWKLLDEKFVASSDKQNINDQERVWGAIQGLASSLNDPYTVFLPPVQSEFFESEIAGNFDGVGMEVGMKDNYLTVIAPLKGNPAEKAGILAGDKILKIDSTDANDLSVEEAVRLIRGEKGTPVILTLFRDEKTGPFDIMVVRDKISIPNVDTRVTKDDVTIIELKSFSAVSPELFREALHKFVLSNTDKLILDLRGNPGGYLEAAVDMASWFLPEGDVIVREDFGGSKTGELYRSKGYDVFNENLKFVILVDKGSASASEILAGALKEHGVATIIGQNTFGKGSVQELIPITPETNLKVTVAQWLTPDGNSISDGGITPDIAVERTVEDFKNNKDPQLDRAIKYLLTGK